MSVIGKFVKKKGVYLNLLGINSLTLNERPIAREPRQRSRILLFSAQRFACTLENPQEYLSCLRPRGTRRVYRITLTPAFSEKRYAACEIVHPYRFDAY
jgi:hypothetical protein